MIIDADAHITPTSEGIGIDELIRRMEKSGIDKALTWLQPPYMRDLEEPNSYVYEAATQYPDKILGFGWADPHFGVESAKDTVKRCINEYGFYGVKLNGAQNSFYIDDPEISLPVVEEIAKLGKLLALHVGADGYEHTHPFRVAKIAERYPELQILVVHMGGVAFADLSDATIEVAEQYGNLTLIGSAVRTIPILKAIRTLGSSKVCFGSDTPFELMHVEVAKYKALLEGEEELSDEDKHNIMAGNMIRLLGLKGISR
jgi:predicted TIM-barrel fold metal-dependent hydrolase